jgi:hypothetical protein
MRRMPRLWMLRHAAGSSGHVLGRNSGFELIRGEDIFTTRRYPGTGEHKSPRRRESRRRGRQRQGALHLRSRSVHCTIRVPIRMPDIAVCRAQISDFHVITC